MGGNTPALAKGCHHNAQPKTGYQENASPSDGSESNATAVLEGTSVGDRCDEVQL